MNINNAHSDNVDHTATSNYWTSTAFEPLTNIEEHFLAQQDTQLSIFQEKNENYGMDNISGGLDLTISENKKESLQALYFRMRDKLARFKQLVENDNEGTSEESIIDTLHDLANYSNIGIIVYNNQWK